MRFAVDTGGTFTDLVTEDSSGTLRMYKAGTTPDDPIGGVLAAFDLAARDAGLTRNELLARGEMLIHGTTHAINAIITGRTAKTAFLTTKGHPDILVIREGSRTDFFNFKPYPEPYVPRSLTFEVAGRITDDGSIREPLDEAALLDSIAKLKEKSIEAIGVCLLWSIVNPIHEVRVGELLDTHLPGIPYTLSHRLNPSLREYRRASSTCIDASLKPLMGRYLGSLGERLRESGFRGRVLVVTTQGGALDAKDMADAPIHSINSGPAMAPIAGRAYARADAGTDMVIVADTGGTTFDVSLVRGGRIPWTRETWIGPRLLGHMTGFPAVDVKSIGAGGGSIAWVDQGGLLHVGPRSAGAAPGPVCYGKGGNEPTVTDAAVVLGWIDPDYFLGGAMKLDVEAAARAIADDVGDKLGLDLHTAASAIVNIATENMVRAIEDITVNQGIDPRSATLIGGGGAAGLNIVQIAQRLGCRQVVLPDVAAALSAVGALISDLRAEFSLTLYTDTGAFDFEGVNDVLAQIEDQCRTFIAGPGAGSLEQVVEFTAEARYPSQIWEVEVPLRSNRFTSDADVAALRADFHKVHEDIFAIADTDSEIEIVGWRANVRCTLREGTDRRLVEDTGDFHSSARRTVYLPDVGMVEAKVVRLEAIDRGLIVEGPAIIESSFTTVVVEPGAAVERRASGSLMITPPAPAAKEASTPGSLDGVQLAILNKRMEAISAKMANTLLRTGRSGVLNSARDFSCCIVTAEHQLLCASESLPVHVLRGADLMCASMKEFHPEATRGDAFLHNSPYHGNTHPADHTILIPVIDDDGVHRFTMVAKAHQADCGNSIPTTYHGSARDVYQEGALIFPAVQIQRDYKDIDDIIRMCRLRIRVPNQWWGDYLAMLGAARIGEREMLALGKEVGWDTLESFSAQWMDYSEQLMAEAIGKMPEGRATCESRHDPFPNAEEGIPVQAVVETRTKDGIIEVDLRDNPDSYPCGLNLSRACSESNALLAVFNGIPDQVPCNEGSFRRIKVHLREGCVAGIAVHPTSCSVATTNVADRVGNAVSRAIAKLGDGFGMASTGSLQPPSLGVISGVSKKTRGPYVNQIFLGWGGGAAAPHCDAWISIGHMGNGGACHQDSVELDEMRFPLFVVGRHYVTDSGGYGRTRGGESMYSEFGPTEADIEVGFVSDGNISAPEGARGGGPGARSNQFRRAPNGDLHQLDPCSQAIIPPDHTIVSYSCGGGGYGSPLERAPQKVAKDVREGWASVEAAHEIYKVVVSADGELDMAATDALRRSG